MRRLTAEFILDRCLLADIHALNGAAIERFLSTVRDWAEILVLFAERVSNNRHFGGAVLVVVVVVVIC